MAGAPKGNTNARRGHMWRDALERALARAVKSGSKTVERGLDPIADKVVGNALNGDRDSWQEIANRLDGKHTTVLANDDDNPLVPDEIVVRLVRPGEPLDKPKKKSKRKVKKKAARK